MKTAIIGSRSLKMELDSFLPHDISLIISGGAQGIDKCAQVYATKKSIPIKIFLPDYALYGRIAPLIRNKQIVEACDRLIAFWDGKSHGTKFTIDYAQKQNKPVRVIRLDI